MKLTFTRGVPYSTVIDALQVAANAKHDRAEEARAEGDEIAADEYREEAGEFERVLANARRFSIGH